MSEHKYRIARGEKADKYHIQRKFTKIEIKQTTKEETVPAGWFRKERIRTVPVTEYVEVEHACYGYGYLQDDGTPPKHCSFFSRNNYYEPTVLATFDYSAAQEEIDRLIAEDKKDNTYIGDWQP